MTTEIKKVWFDGEKVVTQDIPESNIYERNWDIASCKAYAEQLRDKNRANTAEHAAEAIEYLLSVTEKLEVQPETEPLEYWNAVEGWVKIDEVREHFDAVGCGTIYKTAGENRVPVYTTPPQRPWVGLTDEEILDLFDVNNVYGSKWIEFARTVEDKLKEKNT